MKKTARVIITSKCDRKCPGCCNSKLDYTSLAKVIGGITALKDYEEVVITGGEPMINPKGEMAEPVMGVLPKL